MSSRLISCSTIDGNALLHTVTTAIHTLWRRSFTQRTLPPRRISRPRSCLASDSGNIFGISAKIGNIRNRHFTCHLRDASPTIMAVIAIRRLRRQRRPLRSDSEQQSFSRAQQLRADLNEVELTILRHMAYLGVLEVKRREMEMELMQTVCPALTLPPEIVSRIFVECLPGHRPSLSQTDATSKWGTYLTCCRCGHLLPGLRSR
jgi:hypothetical protein